MLVKLLTEHHLEFLSLKRGCTGSSESALVKISHYWKSDVTAQLSGIRHLDIHPLTMLKIYQLPTLLYVHLINVVYLTAVIFIRST